MQTPNSRSIKSTRVAVVPVVIPAINPLLSVTKVGEVPEGDLSGDINFAGISVDPVTKVGEVPGGDLSEGINVAGLLVDSFPEVGETSGGDLLKGVNFVVGPSL